MAETCERCHLVHAGTVNGETDRQILAYAAEACIAAQQTAMRYLLEKIGKRSTCQGCQADIVFLRHTNGKIVPYTLAGLNHFVDCPAREQFVRKPRV